jgi:bifunctional DNA-binding transcriptional regulator/antitoxin component of YhaV-PrlF toxin-antitoxin module
MTALRLRDKGTITLPAEYRKKYRLDKGQIFTMIDMEDGAIMLFPGASEVDRLSNEIARQMKEANITFEDILETLDEERRKLFKEKYGDIAEETTAKIQG